MIVEYDAGVRGVIDSVFTSLDEVWIRDEDSNELVFQRTTDGDVSDIRSFQASTLVFQGEWEAGAEATQTVLIPASTVNEVLVQSGVLQDHCGIVPLDIQINAEGEDGQAVVGPGHPSEVKRACTAVDSFVQELLALQGAQDEPEAGGEAEADGDAPCRPSWLSNVEVEELGLADTFAEPSEEAGGEADGVASGGMPSWLSNMEAKELGLETEPEVSNSGGAGSDGAKGDLDADTAYQLGWEAAMRAAEEKLRNEMASTNDTSSGDRGNRKAPWRRQAAEAEEEEEMEVEMKEDELEENDEANANDEAEEELEKEEQEDREEQEEREEQEAEEENNDGDAAAATSDTGAGAADQGEAPAPNPSAGASMGPGGFTVQEWLEQQTQFAHLPALPAGWIRIKSSSGRIYYMNVESGQTTFDEPAGASAPAPAPVLPPSLPEGWQELQSRSTGKKYYWNQRLGKTQFERPTA